MTERIRFLRQETVSGRNKGCRCPMPAHSTAEQPGGIPIRKALGLRWILENMPIYIGPQERIVGTRTWFRPLKGNEDGHSQTAYAFGAYPVFARQEEISRFGKDYSRHNKQHYTPDFGILLQKGVGGILEDARQRKQDPTLKPHNIEFLDSMILAYTGLQSLICRYRDHAEALCKAAQTDSDRLRLAQIAGVCKKIATEKPETFYEALQLLWFGHLVAMVENFVYICYGRLDVLLGDFLRDTPLEEAQELIDCLLLKMYDQADIDNKAYSGSHQGQLVVTLGGVLENGENAVNSVTMLFLEGIDHIRLPDPEFNLRISSKNPPEFLEKAAQLTVSGCNFVSYYNDDLTIQALVGAGLSPEDARSYGFDLCQDINIPGKGDFYRAYNAPMAQVLMELLYERTDYRNFDMLLAAYKKRLSDRLKTHMLRYNADGNRMLLYREGKYEEYFSAVAQAGAEPVWSGRSPMCPLPYLSGLYHGSLENACDMIYESYPLKHHGATCGMAIEAVNSLAAIKKIVFEEQKYTLEQVVDACKADYAGQEQLRAILWNAPKWGNDDPFVDNLAKDLLEYCLRDFGRYETFSGGRLLAGIHQPHPVSTGWSLMATPEGRHAGKPVAVTMTCESGTMKNGATAVLKSASIFDPMLLQWNYCCMVNYYASVFAGEKGGRLFQTLLMTYFRRGGMQHQPNVLDAQALKNAQLEPEKYKDLIVRLWGVSAHFVDLPKELQDEMIARVS